MQSNDPYFGHGTEPGGSFDIDPAVLRVAGAIAVAMFAASYMPMPLFPLALGNLLQLSAIATTTIAAMLRMPLDDDRVTLWDEAAALGLLGYIALAFVDGAAVQAVLNELGMDAYGGPARSDV